MAKNDVIYSFIVAVSFIGMTASAPADAGCKWCKVRDNLIKPTVQVAVVAAVSATCASAAAPSAPGAAAAGAACASAATTVWNDAEAQIEKK